MSKKQQAPMGVEIDEICCGECGSKQAIMTYKMGRISPLSPFNDTGKFLFVVTENVLVCGQCSKPLFYFDSRNIHRVTPKKEEHKQDGQDQRVNDEPKA